MINPILLSHPANNALEGWTVFVLDLSINDHQFAAVKAALQDIRPEMLLFTRRLQELKISLGPSPAEETLYTVTKDFDDAYSVWTLNSRSAENEHWAYFRQEWAVTDMPEHSKRKGIKESKIVLAFPFDDNKTMGTIVREQQIFAFMPLYRSPLPVHPTMFRIS